MKKLIIAVFISVLLWQIAVNLYRCGQFNGQEVQYDFFMFAEQVQIPYVQLHQYAENPNPFCAEIFNPF